MDKLFQKGVFMDIQIITEILFELKRISNTLKEIEKKLNEKSEKLNDN